MGAGASSSKSSPPLQLRDSTTNVNFTGSKQQQSNSTNSVISSTKQNLYVASTIPSIVISAKRLAAAKKIEKEKEKKKLLEEYPELADSLDSAHEWMKGIENDKDFFFAKRTMGLRTKMWMDDLYNLYFEHEQTEHRKVLAEQISKDKGCEIFTEYMRVLTDDGKNTPAEIGYKFECLEIVRSLCWNYSDASLEFCVDLGRMGMFTLLVADLITFVDKMTDGLVADRIILPCISILHNCAKAPDNQKYLQEVKAVEAVLPYSKVQDPQLKMIAMMTLAYLIDEKDNEMISTDGSMVKFILRYLRGAIAFGDHKYDGFSALEIVTGLMHLASNDKNKVIIVNEGVLPMLVTLMEKGSDEEKEISAKTVWVLSFSNENKKKIRDEPNMMKNLQLLTKSPGPAKESASGALWVLDDEERVGRILSNISSLNGVDSLALKSSLSFGKKKATLKHNTKFKARGDISISEKSAAPKKKSVASSSKHESSLRSSVEKQNFFAKEDFPDTEKEKDQVQEEMESEEDVEEEEKEAEEMESEGEEQERAQIRHPQDLEEIVQYKSSTPKHIMISYQWGCQKLMIRVKERLERQNYRVWIDVESMGGSTLQAMAEAVENADAVLICMSKKYKESPNCRTEAEYAYKLGKTLIPLRVEATYEADGWLGALQGAKFYFDFSNLTLFDGVFSKLVKEIGDRGKMCDVDQVDGPIPSPKTVHILPPIRKEKIPVVMWDKLEVEKWAQANSITSKKVVNLDGESIVFLHSLKTTAPEFFYKYASDRLGITELRDLMNLSKGLDSLDN